MNTKPFETVQKLAKLYNQGMTQVEIAKMYGVTQALISYYMRRAGVVTRKQKPTPQSKLAAKEKHVRGKSHPFFHDIPIDILTKEYKEGVAVEVLSAKYKISRNGILRKLKQAAVFLRKEGFSGWHTAKDGHKVQSRLELAVDEWLYEHKIKHVTQPPLPFGKNTKSDFLVGDVYIEVLGLTSKEYKLKYAKKAELYKLHSMKVIYILPSDIRNGLDILKRFL